jgi:hypothetical protein
MEPAKRGTAIDRAVRDDAQAAAYLDHVRQSREHRLAAARCALDLDRKAHFLYEGCASFAEFGDRRTGSPSEAAMDVALGHALERWPDLEAKVLAGLVSLTSAARLGTLARLPEGVREGEDWVALAAGAPERALARRVAARREEVRTGGKPVVERTFYLSTRGDELFEDARKIASRKAGRALTEGEAVEELADHYLDGHDPRRVEPGKRRLPDTATLPDRNRRKPAAEVVRMLLERNGDACAVEFCGNAIFLENSHRVPHAEGGAREAKDLDRLCRTHHDLYERGLLRIEGPTDAPRFSTDDGRSLDSREGTAWSGDPPPG